ncbi:Cathepsin B-like cysteine proteinase 3 [Dirofilaria immitis]|nr:Cathepsin B-like cysteine proteinase 3 [Dirofilaria immitis]
MSKRNLSIDYEDLESEFDYANDAGSSIDGGKNCRIQDDELWKKPRLGEIALPCGKKRRIYFMKNNPASKSAYFMIMILVDIYLAINNKFSLIFRRKQRLMTLDVYTRHKELINQYYLCYPGATAKLQRDTSRDRTDYDVLKDNHRFLWNDDELIKAAEKSWEARLAKRYYDKLFKEYCIADLSQYKKNRIAMRWRTEREVKSGKGQFECGSKRCEEKVDLTSWENSVKKNALVKLRLCPECSKMLNYHSQKKKLEKKINPEKELPVQANTSEVQELAISKDISEEIQQNAIEKLEKNELMEIWRKSPESTDPEKVTEQELDDFLNDLLL